MQLCLKLGVPIRFLKGARLLLLFFIVLHSIINITFFFYWFIVDLFRKHANGPWLTSRKFFGRYKALALIFRSGCLKILLQYFDLAKAYSSRSFVSKRSVVSIPCLAHHFEILSLVRAHVLVLNLVQRRCSGLIIVKIYFHRDSPICNSLGCV